MTPFPSVSRLAIAALLTCLPQFALAEAHATGSWAVVADSGETLLGLDLTEAGGRITGTGVVPEGALGHGPGLVELRYGARLGDGMQLILRLDAHDAAVPDTNLRVTVAGDDTLRLLYNGTAIDARLEPVAAGSITVPPAPAEAAPAPVVVETTPQVVETAPEVVEVTPDVVEVAPQVVEVTPEVVDVAPQVVEVTPEVVEVAPEGVDAAEAPPSCRELDRVTAEANAAGGTEIVQDLRSIYTIYGLAFGGEQTEAKCQGALAEVVILLEGMGDEPAEAEACIAVEGAMDAILTMLDASGVSDLTRTDTIMAEAGMRVPGLNPGGTDTTETCTRALPPLYSYLAELQTAPPSQTVQPEIVEDSPDMGDLPAGYRIEPIFNINQSGDWRAAAGGQNVGLWQLFRNQLAMEASADGRRTFWFWEPAPAFSNRGAVRGVLFVEGQIVGNGFTGEARHFQGDCGAYVYPVSGNVMRNGLRLQLTGMRPEVGSDCAIVGTTEQNLNLRFVADAPPGAPNLNTNSGGGGGTAGAGASDTPNFGVWALRYQIRGIDAGGALNIRRNPSTNAAVVGEIPHNGRDIRMLGEGCTPVIDQTAFDRMNRRERVRELRDKWCRIEWQGRQGWVYGRYLRPM